MAAFRQSIQHLNDRSASAGFSEFHHHEIWVRAHVAAVRSVIRPQIRFQHTASKKAGHPGLLHEACRFSAPDSLRHPVRLWSDLGLEGGASLFGLICTAV